MFYMQKNIRWFNFFPIFKKTLHSHESKHFPFPFLKSPFLFVFPIISPKKIEKTEAELFESIKRRKIEKKQHNNQLSEDENSSSESDQTFEEFFSSSDESSNEVLDQESSAEESKNP